ARVRRLSEDGAVVGGHEDRVVAAGEALPDPGRVAAHAPDVVRVQPAHLLALPGRRVVPRALRPGPRDPARPAWRPGRPPPRPAAWPVMPTGCCFGRVRS